MAPTDTTDDRTTDTAPVRAPRRVVPRWLQRRLLATADLVAVGASWLVVLGYVWGVDSSGSQVPPRTGWVLAATVVTMVVLSREQVYLARVHTVRAVEVLRVGRASLVAAVVLGVVDRLVGTPLGVAVIAAGTGAAGGALLFGRMLLGAWLHDASRRGEDGRSLLLVGRPATARRVLALLGTRPELGYRVLGYVAPERSPTDVGVPWLGRPDDLDVLTDLTAVSGVLVAAGELDARTLRGVLTVLDGLDVHVHVVVDDGGEQRIRLLPLSPRPPLDPRPRLSAWQRTAKRGLDLVVGGVLAVVAVPVVGLAAALLMSTGARPTLVREVHVDPSGAPLALLRLRTRRPPRSRAARRVAAACRALCVDELPQLWSVLVGSMSLVGPRPLRPSLADGPATPTAVAHAGLVGLRHVEAPDYPGYGPHRRAEVFYAENWSVGLDLSILAASVSHLIWRTIRPVRGGDGPTAAIT